MSEDLELEKELNQKLTMTGAEIFRRHPLPWSHHLLLIKDANGRQVIHIGGAYNERGKPHQGEYLSGLNALLVDAVNSRSPSATEERLREALDGLIRHRLSTGPCWCPSRVSEHGDWFTPGEHSKACDAARSALNVSKEVEDE